jgi:hypothetical protein
METQVESLPRVRTLTDLITKVDSLLRKILGLSLGEWLGLRSQEFRPHDFHENTKNEGI